MPARLSSMELSSPSNPDVDSSARPSRRKSGRVSKQPDFLSPGNGKRKRRTEGVQAGDEDVDQDMEDASDVDDNEENDDEPDEEELREERRKKKRKVAADKPKPATKKQKPNGVITGTSTTLARRPAKKIPKPQKGQIESALQVGGLYGETICEDRP